MGRERREGIGKGMEGRKLRKGVEGEGRDRRGGKKVGKGRERVKGGEGCVIALGGWTPLSEAVSVTFSLALECGFA